MNLRLACRGWLLPLLSIAILLTTAGCSKHITSETTTVGPYSNFAGRLIMFEPNRRLQVWLQWHADSPEQGDVRLTHAATGTVVEFRWSGHQMQLRDNNNRHWRTIRAEQLAEHGIVIPPHQLASILLGKMPAHFINKKAGEWESRQRGSLIRLQWDETSQRLTMSDIKHGRRAILLIQP